MVNWPAFRMGQYSVNDHPYHAPQLKHPFGRGLENSISRIMREIYEMENPNPLLFEEIVEIRKMMATDESEVLKRMEFDADFRAYIKSFLKEIRTNKLYTWYKCKTMQPITIFKIKN